jgi:mannose-6-phosphate isomerase-like protein (cupin superfamily)
VSEPIPPTIHRPGEGERLTTGKMEAVIKAPAEATGGRFYLAEGRLDAGVSGPPPHLHRQLTDMFYVLEGTLSVLVGEDWQDLPAGSFAAVPPGNVHAFTNNSDEEVRFLNLSVPGGFEAYMRELFEVSRRPDGATPEEMADIFARHDIHFPE